MAEVAAAPVVVQPLVAWPREAEPGRTYLMTVDLELPRDAPWPYEEEEVLIHCLVSVSDTCGIEPTGSPAVVLHRFGSTYGAARFLLTAYEPVDDAGLQLMLLSRSGMPLARFPLKMRVLAGASAMPEAYRTRHDPGGELPRRSGRVGMRTVLIRIVENGSGWRVELCHDDGQEEWLRRPVASELMPARLEAFAPPPLAGGRTGVEAIRAVLLEQAAQSRDFERIGAHLRAVLADGAVGAEWDEIVDRQSGFGSQDGVRLLLDVQPEPLRMLPWELMCRGATRLAADVRNPVARITPSYRAFEELPPVRWPLRVLVVVGSREDDTIVEAEQEIGELKDVFRRMPGLVDVEFLAQPSRAQVQERHKELRPHIFHFIGHGRVEDGRGHLELFDAERGETLAWTPARIGMDLAGWKPRLAILNACRTSDAYEQQGAWSVSEEFTRLGVPAVIMMQADIRGDSAAAFTGGLYRALTDGEPLDAAVAAGRVAITHLRDEEHRDFALPSLSVSWPPESILKLGSGARDQLRPPVEHLHSSWALFLDRSGERRRLLRWLDAWQGEQAAQAPDAIAISGPAQVGKSTLARWFVASCAMRGVNAAYVDFDRGKSLGFMETLAITAATLSAESTLGERNQRAFAAWTDAVEALGLESGAQPSRSPRADAVDTAFGLFADALRTAADGRPLVMALDHVGRIQEQAWEMISTWLLERIAQHGLAPVRAIVVLSEEQSSSWSPTGVQTAGSAHVELAPFEPRHFKALATEYLASRFDVERRTIEHQLDALPVTSDFSWNDLRALAELGSAFGWRQYA